MRDHPEAGVRSAAAGVVRAEIDRAGQQRLAHDARRAELQPGLDRQPPRPQCLGNELTEQRTLGVDLRGYDHGSFGCTRPAASIIAAPPAKPRRFTAFCAFLGDAGLLDARLLVRLMPRPMKQLYQLKSAPAIRCHDPGYVASCEAKTAWRVLLGLATQYSSVARVDKHVPAVSNASHCPMERRWQ